MVQISNYSVLTKSTSLFLMPIQHVPMLTNHVEGSKPQFIKPEISLPCRRGKYEVKYLLKYFLSYTRVHKGLSNLKTNLPCMYKMYLFARKNETRHSCVCVFSISSSFFKRESIVTIVHDL